MQSQPLMSDQKLRLIVGLGNPGQAYRMTRHNVGFQLVDRIAAAFGVPLDRKRFGALFGQGVIEGHSVILLKPQQYMNISGPPTKLISDYFSISSEDIIVIHDDIDLAFKRIKIKAKGGHGGHKGIISLIDALGGGDFVRLRIGIGRRTTGQKAPNAVVDHVLGLFSAEETEALEEILERAQAAVVTILCEGTKAGMNQFNSRKATNLD